MLLIIFYFIGFLSIVLCITFYTGLKKQRTRNKHLLNRVSALEKLYIDNLRNTKLNHKSYGKEQNTSD